jgi:GT2 family glycosyltransferase
VGFGVGNNVGIAYALNKQAKYIFLLNQDGYVTTDTISHLLSFLEQNQDIGLVSPLHCSPDLEHLDQKTLRAYMQTYAVEYLSDACVSHVKDYYIIRGVNAAAWFVRSSVFRQVGGFDPLFFMYGEDDDLIARFAFHNIRFALLPSAKFVHLRQSSSSTPRSRWQKISRLSERSRSELLIELKSPRVGLTYRMTLLVAKGLVAPLAQYLIDRNGSLLLACLLSTLRLSRSLRTIHRHGLQCRQSGPHFLNQDATEQPLYTPHG